MIDKLMIRLLMKLHGSFQLDHRLQIGFLFGFRMSMTYLIDTKKKVDEN
jgi:hypothetical protein